MSTRVLLRIAALLTALLSMGHVLGSPWTPAQDVSGRAVIGAMKAFRFDAMGVQRSYYDFYQGFGWMLSAYLIGHAILFWQLSAPSGEMARAFRSVVAMLCVESLCLVWLGIEYLFWVPVALSAGIALCLVGAVLRMFVAHAPISMPPDLNSNDGG